MRVKVWPISKGMMVWGPTLPSLLGYWARQVPWIALRGPKCRQQRKGCDVPNLEALATNRLAFLSQLQRLFPLQLVCELKVGVTPGDLWTNNTWQIYSVILRIDSPIACCRFPTTEGEIIKLWSSFAKGVVPLRNIFPKLWLLCLLFYNSKKLRMVIWADLLRVEKHTKIYFA